MYKVVVLFTDLQDDNHLYNVGDIYPRKGRRATKKRIAELASIENKRGVQLIAEVEEEKSDD